LHIDLCFQRELRAVNTMPMKDGLSQRCVYLWFRAAYRSQNTRD
jgi:hypothetical protein